MRIGTTTSYASTVSSNTYFWQKAYCTSSNIYYVNVSRNDSQKINELNLVMRYDQNDTTLDTGNFTVNYWANWSWNAHNVLHGSMSAIIDSTHGDINGYGLLTP